MKSTELNCGACTVAIGAHTNRPGCAEYSPPKKLLNIDANAKTVKGQKKGFMTAVLYLAPFKSAGVNVCPMAELAGCWKGCLNTAGRGGISKGSVTMNPHGIELPDNAIQNARIKRTRFYAYDRETFMSQLVREIEAFQRKAERAGLIPVVRLNGTSDIQWERGHAVSRLNPGARELIKRSNGATLKRHGAMLAQRFDSIFDAFPELQFYDYTKIYKRFTREMPANYHLSLSYSEASEKFAQACRQAHVMQEAPLVMVARNADVKARMLAEYGRSVDGDETDLRFLDPDSAIVILKAKGSARSDASGFVLD